MTSYAAIQLLQKNFGAILASLKDSPGGEARFVEACLKYPYKENTDIYFIRGNYQNKEGMYDFSGHIMTGEEIDQKFTTTLQSNGKYRAKPGGEWFVVNMKEETEKDPVKMTLNHRTGSSRMVKTE
jgi:hypothetical protein